MRTLCIAAIAILAGCGGSQPPIGATGAMQQTFANATHADRGKSWMLPEAKTEDLWYVAETGLNVVYVVSYTTHQLVGTLTGFQEPFGICADKAGNVWIVNGYSGDASAVEYAHGGTSPIATLTGMGEYPNDCSVDPTTGNLAVSVWAEATGVAIYAKAQGQPTIYDDSSALYLYDCTYDNVGNLYVSGVPRGPGFTFAELPAGSQNFTQITVEKHKIRTDSLIQWDGKYVAIAEAAKGANRIVYRVNVSNGVAKVMDSLKLFDSRGGGQPWIGRGILALNFPGENGRLSLWKYPDGGKTTRVIHFHGTEQSPLLFSNGGPGVALSVAPH